MSVTSAEYNDRNQELFAERLNVINEIADVKASITTTRKGGGPRRRLEIQLKRLNRRLNDVDTEIIKLNYGLVLNYVRKFTSTTSRDDSRDFEGAAVLGLMRAISTYDPNRGSKFSTWAYKPIQRECLRAVRDADFKQLNPGDFEKRPDILRAAKEIAGDDQDLLQRSYVEIAKMAGTSVETVKRVLHSPEHQSLSKPVGDDGRSYVADLLEDVAAPVDEQIINAQEISDLETFGLSALDDRELFVVSRRFGLDGEPAQRLSSIGTMLGLSREAVRQIEAKALSKLNHPVVRRKLARHGRD
jgi:DNA-directed RNA polymerase specialized sigma subunit